MERESNFKVENGLLVFEIVDRHTDVIFSMDEPPLMAQARRFNLKIVEQLQDLRNNDPRVSDISLKKVG